MNRLEQRQLMGRIPKDVQISPLNKVAPEVSEMSPLDQGPQRTSRRKLLRAGATLYGALILGGFGYETTMPPARPSSEIPFGQQENNNGQTPVGVTPQTEAQFDQEPEPRTLPELPTGNISPTGTIFSGK